MTIPGYNGAIGTISPLFSTTRDVHSYSEPEKVRISHVDLELHASFERKVIEGIAILKIVRTKNSGSDPLVLDTRGLSINQVEVGRHDQAFKIAKYRMGPIDRVLGAPLVVELPADADRVRISYKTGSNASGLQWLDAAQTAGQQSPFLYTQSQAIHARSWIPLQDTPAVRITYSARVQVPAGLLAVMSAADNTASPRNGWFEFQMDHPIPSYLIALAVGDLSFAATGNRTGVYAEPQVIDRAAYEFQEAEKMLEAAEQLYGPYLWGRFDILVLPPSFPFGGMENPGLIFVTPTLIAGDRSSVSVIAHELAHAWSGNLVTNATWSDFWLNEGFTTYIEYRIQERLYGKSRAEMEEVLAQQRLAKEMAKLEPRDQILHIDLEGRDPDSGTTLVPYVKGALFLQSLEKAFGRQRFDDFLKSYFFHFKFQSITTEQAINYLKTNLFEKYPEVPFDESLSEWIDEPGLPASAPRASSELLGKVRQQAEEWQGCNANHLRTQNWNAPEWLYFLRSLPPELGAEKMKELDETFHLTRAKNAEIVQQWLLMAVRNQYEPAYSRLEEFLATVGRRIYIKPLYEELVRTDDGKRFAQAIYSRVRNTYHPISQAAIDKIVGAPNASEPLG
jgi:leukotriene-A4 hydrolase